MIVKMPNPDYANHPAYGGLFGRGRFIAKAKAFKRYAPKFLKNFFLALKFYKRLPKGDYDRRNPVWFERLIEDGAAAWRMEQGDIAELLKKIGQYVARLEARKSKIPAEKRKFSDHSLHIPESDAGFYSWLGELFGKYDIQKIIESYSGRRMNLKTAAVFLNDPQDEYWKDHFADVGLPDPPTAYMHTDSSMRWLKCMVYLSEVREENGPFSYVLGSNNFYMSFWEYVARKSSDMSGLDKCERNWREMFWTLPHFLQRKCELGNDFLEGDPAVKMLLEREKKFTSAEGNMIIFDTDGVHRGGMVHSGRRLALIAAFMPGN